MRSVRTPSRSSKTAEEAAYLRREELIEELKRLVKLTYPQLIASVDTSRIRKVYDRPRSLFSVIHFKRNRYRKLLVASVPGTHNCIRVTSEGDLVYYVMEDAWTDNYCYRIPDTPCAYPSDDILQSGVKALKGM